MKGQVVLFTGFHPKDLEAEVVKQGGELADSFGKKVTLLVIKDATVSNEKTKKALAAGINVLTAEQFSKVL
jgi:NAD-dependent DNA ligase